MYQSSARKCREKRFEIGEFRKSRAFCDEPVCESDGVLCTVRTQAGPRAQFGLGRIDLSRQEDMADSATTAPAAAATPKKGKTAASASKKPRTKPIHPPTADMVNAAIKNLKERGGSSLQAIKKYIAANYKVDAEKLAPFIRKYLKSAVASGKLSQPKGKGASGSFKLSVKTEGKPAATTGSAKKVKRVAKPKAGEKKPKAAGTPKKAAAKKPAAKKAKSPSKAKKVSKPPTKKPKSPKPKKAAVKKPKTPKKTAAKKK